MHYELICYERVCFESSVKKQVGFEQVCHEPTYNKLNKPTWGKQTCLVITFMWYAQNVNICFSVKVFVFPFRATWLLFCFKLTKNCFHITYIRWCQHINGLNFKWSCVLQIMWNICFGVLFSDNLCNDPDNFCSNCCWNYVFNRSFSCCLCWKLQLLLQQQLLLLILLLVQHLHEEQRTGDLQALFYISSFLWLSLCMEQLIQKLLPSKSLIHVWKRDV